VLLGQPVQPVPAVARLVIVALEAPALQALVVRLAGLSQLLSDTAPFWVLLGSGFVFKEWDPWRSRPRFRLEPPPTVDQVGRVRVDVVPKGNTT
jgi:hypothetical protein